MSTETIRVLEDAGIKITQQLAGIESELLDFFVANTGKTVRKAEIEAALYDSSRRIQPASNSIEVHVSRIRKKLSDPTVIQTVRGIGYMFVRRQLALVSVTAGQADKDSDGLPLGYGDGPSPDALKEPPPCS